MATVFPGRYTAAAEGGFVVFLIGMRLNRPWKVHRWLPVFMAMPDAGPPRPGPLQGLARLPGPARPAHRHRAPVLAELRGPGALRPFQGRPPPVRLATLQPDRGRQRRRRHLARDLPGGARGLRVHLRRHAPLRPGRGHGARPGGEAGAVGRPPDRGYERGPTGGAPPPGRLRRVATAPGATPRPAVTARSLG